MLRTSLAIRCFRLNAIYSRGTPCIRLLTVNNQSSATEVHEIGGIPVPTRQWTWSSNTPRKAGRTADIEVKLKVPLTVDEIVESLKNNGGTDLRVVFLEGKSDLAEAMIFCTGKSMRHMQRLSDSITFALKQRKLTNAPGITGAEGYDCDDWMIVDCWNLIVHVFEEKYRKKLNLEEHWENMTPLESKDWLENLDYDSEDLEGEVENDDDIYHDDPEYSSEIFSSEAEEKNEADRIAALWKAHISGVKNAGGKGL